MNRLPLATRATILRLLTDGMGVRATARAANVSKGAVLRLLTDAAEFVSFYSDLRLRGLRTPHLQMDEQWSFYHAKAGRSNNPNHGDLWVFAALDTESRLVVSHLVGSRTSETTHEFVRDAAARTVGLTQISTDGWQPYHEAIAQSFGWQRADYAIVIKKFEAEQIAYGRGYGASVVTGVEKIRAIGKPDMDLATTSNIENLNLHTRQKCRRFARLTQMHSKTVEAHKNGIALNFFAHNFMRVHSGLTKEQGRKTTPAMMHGLASNPLSAEWLARMCDPLVTIE